MAQLTLVARQSDTGAGSARGEGSNSLSGLVSTLVPNLIIAAAFILLFLIFRRHFRRVYAPRTYIDMLGKQRQTPTPSNSMFGWIKDFKAIKDEYILDHQSIDGYLFVRFFKLLIVICFLGCLITWPILFPINATGGNNEQQLDMLTIGNVSDYNRYYAHALVSVVFLVLVMVIVARESFYAVNLRQAYRRSPWGSSRLSSRTILFTSVPKDLSRAALFEMFPGVKHVWVASNCKDLQDLVDERDDMALQLEIAEVQLSRDANQNRLKTVQGKKAYQSENSADGTRWLNPKDRPTHRLKPLIGKKVDTIEYGRQQMAELIPKVEQKQAKHWNGQGDIVGAVFIEFVTQNAAQDAWQIMQDKKTRVKSKMQARQLGILPQEICWNNLRIGKLEFWARWAVATAFITVMIVFWAVPVAVVGTISQVNYLTSQFTWLEWINSIPDVILGVITGLLPTIALAILMALVPIICRLAAKLAGYPTLSQIELQTQHWYFAFQVIQVFLITTCAGAVTSVISRILDTPSDALTLLSNNLPKASNFFINYIILYGLAFVGAALLNIVAFLLIVLLSRILPGKTPRKIFQKLTKLSAPAWGSEYPKWANLGVIALSYSGIAPLILGFATIGFVLVYIAFRYNFLYVYEPFIDTKGAAYEKALRQVMTGVYLSEICLIGLFAIATGNQTKAAGPLAIEVVLLACTIVFQVCLKSALKHHEAREVYSDTAPASGHRVENGMAEKDATTTNGHPAAGPPRPSRLPGFVQRIINPERNQVHNLSSSLDQFYHQPMAPLAEDIQKRAFFHPAVVKPTPILWIVRDEMGISQREIRDTQKAVPRLHITDEQAVFDEKGKVHWHGAEEGRARAAPVYEEEIIY